MKPNVSFYLSYYVVACLLSLTTAQLSLEPTVGEEEKEPSTRTFGLFGPRRPSPGSSFAGSLVGSFLGGVLGGDDHYPARYPYYNNYNYYPPPPPPPPPRYGGYYDYYGGYGGYYRPGFPGYGESGFSGFSGSAFPKSGTSASDKISFGDRSRKIT